MAAPLDHWPLDKDDSVCWWDGARRRQGRFMRWSQKGFAQISEQILTDLGIETRERSIDPARLRPSNDQRTVRSRGHAIYIDKKEGTWGTTLPEPSTTRSRR